VGWTEKAPGISALRGTGGCCWSRENSSEVSQTALAGVQAIRAGVSEARATEHRMCVFIALASLLRGLVKFRWPLWDPREELGHSEKSMPQGVKARVSEMATAAAGERRTLPLCSGQALRLRPVLRSGLAPSCWPVSAGSMKPPNLS
jgi:hypothetical protein